MKLLQVSMILVVLFLMGATAAPLSAAPPNIIYIMADDLGWTDLSTGRTNLGNGSDFYETPNIDRLVSEGMAFTSSRMQPNCAPTRAALLSGQYAARSGNGVYNVQSLNRGSKGRTQDPNERPEYSHSESRLVPPPQVEDVPASAITVAEALQASGYVTAHFGKFHVGGRSPETFPEMQGFDFNFAGCTFGHQKSCFAREGSNGWTYQPFVGRPELDPYAAPYDAEYLEANDLPDSLESTPKHICDAMGDALLDFIQTHRESDVGEKPFYAQFHPYAVHGPHQPRSDLQEYFADQTPGERHQSVNYAAFIRGLDGTVGRLLDYLDDPNGDGDPSDSIAGDTYVFFTSDNGGAGPTTNVPLRRHKGTFYDGGLRVPLIARRPGVVEAGATSDTLVHAIDFYPTFLDVAKGNSPDPTQHSLDGESFASVLRGEESTRDRKKPICYYFPGYMDNRAWPIAVTIQEIDDLRYKLLYSYETGMIELYCLSNDISETTNLLGEENRELNMELGNEMIDELNAWLLQDDPTWNPGRVTDKATGELVPLAVPSL